MWVGVEPTKNCGRFDKRKIYNKRIVNINLLMKYQNSIIMNLFEYLFSYWIFSFEFLENRHEHEGTKEGHLIVSTLFIHGWNWFEVFFVYSPSMVVWVFGNISIFLVIAYSLGVWEHSEISTHLALSHSVLSHHWNVLWWNNNPNFVDFPKAYIDNAFDSRSYFF